MTHPGPEFEFSDSDQAWLDALHIGASTGDPEALLLRNALQAERQLAELQPAVTDPALRESQLHKLLFELRRQGVLKAEAPPSEPGRRWPLVAGWALAATVVLGVGLSVLRPPDATYDEPPVWRGGEAEAVRTDADPHAAAEAAAARLRAQGLSVLIYQEGQAFVLDVEVPAARAQALRSLLQAEGLPAEAGIHRLRLQR